MKTVFLSAAAAVAVLTISPSFAQPAPTAPMTMQPMTRAGIAAMIQQHFAMLDTNRDGLLTKAEMDAGKMARHDRTADRKASRGDARFDRLDSNHDGAVTRPEFDSAHQATGDDGHKGAHRMGMMMHAGMGGRMFEMADANKDGRVSLQEATNAALSHFDRADANHDGTLTTDEMHAAHQAMRGGRR